MKKQLLFTLAMLGLILSLGCQEEEAPVLNDPAVEARVNNNSFAFPKTARPYGKSIADWTADWWSHMYSFDCANLPLNDVDGSNAGLNLDGPVIFLPGNSGGTTSRTITVPHGKALLFPLINALWDYHPSCPGFELEEGQTVEEFILSQFDPVLSTMVANLSATLNSYSFTNLTNYRFTTGLYPYTVNTDLANCLDPCMEIADRFGLADGYWIMLKPLHYGQHTLNFHGEIPNFGFEVDVTYEITVE
jgi:hypothetical protein